MIKKVKRAALSLPGFFSALMWCFKMSWETSRFYTLLRMSVEALTPLLAIVAVFIGRGVINLLAGVDSGSGHETQRALLLLGSLLAVALLRKVCGKLVEYCRAMHEDMMGAKIAALIMSHALSADLEYFDNSAYYDKLRSANRDSYSIMHIVWNSIIIVSSVISLAMALAVLSQMHPFYGAFMLLAAIPSSIIAARYTKMLYMLSLEQINGKRRMAYLQDIATERKYSQDFRLFDAGAGLKARYMRVWRELFTTRRKVTRRRTILVSALECLPETTAALIGVHIAFQILAGNGTVGDYSLLAGLVAQLLSAIFLLSYSVMHIYDNRMKLDNFKSIERFVNKVSDSGMKVLDSVDVIEFRDVCFSYPATDVRALSNIDLRLNKDEKVALVGLNGSGKSTFIKLLLRLYDPDEGAIFINGHDIKEYTLASLRGSFSVYFQDMSNFSFTLQENMDIADCGYPEGDKENAAEAALKAAVCGEILERAHKGLDTHITRLFSDDGIELSGGQHQKLALARSLYRRHIALILDEPSSNLDPKAEHEVFEHLKHFTEGKMTIFTSHRLTNVFLANRIIVLEEGRVLEDGTQQELLLNQSRYAELFGYQQEKFSQSAGDSN